MLNSWAQRLVFAYFHALKGTMLMAGKLVQAEFNTANALPVYALLLENGALAPSTRLTGFELGLQTEKGVLTHRLVVN